jgi:hypothetical protein
VAALLGLGAAEELLVVEDVEDGAGVGLVAGLVEDVDDDVVEGAARSTEGPQAVRATRATVDIPTAAARGIPPGENMGRMLARTPAVATPNGANRWPRPGGLGQRPTTVSKRENRALRGWSTYPHPQTGRFFAQIRVPGPPDARSDTADR